MVNQIVVLQRLFNHGQIEFIGLTKDVDVVQPVAAVAVNVKCLIGELLPHFRQHAVVPAGAKLQFDPRKPVINGLSNGRDQIVQ